MNYKTFGSHASRDRKGSLTMGKFFTLLRERLAALTAAEAPAEMIFEDLSIGEGEEWSPALVKAMVEADAFFFLVSPYFRQSPWCGREVMIALNRYQRWKERAGQSAGGCLLFPIRWEVDQLRRLAESQSASENPDHDIPPPLRPFQHRPPNAPAIYEERGLRWMFSQSKHRSKREDFVEKLALAIISGTARGTLPPHPTFQESEWATIPLPEGWTTPASTLLFDVSYHLSVAGGSFWLPQEDGPSIQEVLERCAELMWVELQRMEKTVGPADAAEPPGAAKIDNRIHLLILDTSIPPDAVVRAVDARKGSLHLAVIFLSTDSSGGAVQAVIPAWLDSHQLSQGQIAAAFAAGCVKQTSAARLATDIEIVVQKAKSRALKSQSGSPATDESVSQSAREQGLDITSKPQMMGPKKDREP